MTTRPGTGLRRIAARLLPPATVERFVDPAVADLQHEYTAALARTRWRAQAIRVAGTLRLLQVIALLSGRYGLRRGWERLAHPNRAVVVITDRAMATVGGLTPTIAIGMAIATGMMAVRYSAYPGAELQISAFVVLSAFDAGCLQFGFALALLTTTRRTRAVRLKMTALLAMSLLFSAVSVYIIGVTLPSAQVLSPAALVDHAFILPGDARSMLFAYGTRIAAGVSPLLFCVFALTLARRVRIAVAFPAAISVCAAYVVWFTWLRHPLIASSVPIRLAVWAPDVAIVLSTLLLAYAYTDRNLRETFTR
jgi:hypothetical protein